MFLNRLCTDLVRSDKRPRCIASCLQRAFGGDRSSSFSRNRECSRIAESEALAFYHRNFSASGLLGLSSILRLTDKIEMCDEQWL
jgi:hypothetical protein